MSTQEAIVKIVALVAIAVIFTVGLVVLGGTA